MRSKELSTAFWVVALGVTAVMIAVVVLLVSSDDEGSASLEEPAVQQPTMEVENEPRRSRRSARQATTADSNNDDGEQAEELPAVGPRRWAAEPDDVDLEALERRLEQGEMEQEFELALRRDRVTSIEFAEKHVERCREELKRRLDHKEQMTESEVGDVAVQWKITTEGGRGTIDEPEILHQLGARDAEFEQCVETSLAGKSFDAVGDGGELVVRRAFFVDAISD